MFDEQFVTTAEEIREAREALIELGRDIPRRGNEVELWQAQIAYTTTEPKAEALSEAQVHPLLKTLIL
jgi:hypothetical protein